MDFTKKLTKTLIEMYWERPCLWKTGTEDYKNLRIKWKAYGEIADHLRSNGMEDANIDTVRFKIRNLRRVLRKERNKVRDSGGSYRPCLWYYDLLNFITEEELSGGQQDGVNQDSVSFVDVRAQQTTDSDNEDYVVPARKSIKKSKEEPIKMEYFEVDEDDSIPLENSSFTNNRSRMINITETPERSLTNDGKTDEFDAIGINYAAKLRRMDPNQAAYAELLIQKVLTKGLFGRLNDAFELVELDSVHKSK